MSDGSGAPRELNNSMTGVLLAYVRRVAGEQVVAAVLEAAGDSTPLPELEDPGNWSSYDATLQRFVAASTVLGDPEIGSKAGAELFEHYSSTQTIALLRSLGSPAAALEVIAEAATKQSTVVTMECVEHGDNSALVSARTMPPIRRHRVFCDYTAGALGSIPAIFGLERAAVVERECQRRGDTRCLYEVAWDPSSATDPQVRAHFLAAQVAALTGRFEALEALATELASMADVDAALQTITERAGVAVWAPRFLLVVRLPRERTPRVHSVGFDIEEAQQHSAELLVDEPDDHDGARLIVDVESSEHSFGRLAAFYPDGHRFLPEERRLLQAYAGHAAAVLATAAALAEARQRAETIGAMFDLATALSEVGTTDEVAERLARALPPVVECDDASVFVWEPRDTVLVCRGRSALPEEREGPGQRPTKLHLDRSMVGQLTRRAEPLSFGTEDSDPEWDGIGAAAGYRAGVLVPVVARRDLLGVVVAGWDQWSMSPGPTTALRERLHGVAGIAATAFDNARLLEQIRHQAGHDSLTGLPNARLLEELADAALATARRHGYGVGLLFVDLDLFKSVNDELGHHAGDQLLVEVGARLRAAVRTGDTVARLGGDEFGVLLPHVVEMAEAEAVARRIVEALGQPVTGVGHPVVVTASVGIAVSPAAAETFDSMVRRADVAMYEVKGRGRNGFRVQI